MSEILKSIYSFIVDYEMKKISISCDLHFHLQFRIYSMWQKERAIL